MRRILVVDDNVAFAENIAEIIAEAGVAEAAIADSGARALEVLQRERFDAMITDMRMPEMNGAQLIERARQLDPELPVVMITAFTGDEDLARATHEGLLTVLAKPVPMRPLIELIAHARRGRPVLIVDDNVALAENVAESLRGRGVASVLVHSVAEIERVASSPSVALVDLRLPDGEDGAALARVTARFPESAVVVMTAFRNEVDALPGVPVIDKPFAMERLLEAVEKLFVERQPSRSGG